MVSSKAETSSSQYVPLALHDDSNDSITTLQKQSSEDDHSVPLLETSNTLPVPTQSKPSQLPKFIFYFFLALMLLSTVNVALLPATLSRYLAYPLSDSEIEALPYGDAG